MKKYIILSILALLFTGLKGQKYQVSGTLDGSKDGVIVKLYDQDSYPYKVIDSTVVKDQKFVF